MHLSQNQKKAALHYTGPALTIAIPGSGKTTLLLERLHHLTHHHNIIPAKILTLTFSRAAAQDMKNRISDTAYPIYTIHSFAYQFIRSSNLQLITKQQQKRVLQQIIHRPLGEEETEQLINEIGLLYNAMLTRKQPHNITFSFDNIFDIATDYHRAKQKNRWIDFDDMTLKAYRKLSKNPSLLQRIQNNFSFVQVDEAQDTSKLQFKLIELLSQNLFLVADDDQSIYGFRGAFPEYILHFKQNYPKAQIYHLDENYRSDANIIQMASHFIGKNKWRHQKNVQPTLSAQTPVQLIEWDDIFARNQSLITQIQEEKGSTAILFRNNLSSISLIDLFDRHDININIKEIPMSEWHHPVLQDVIHFLNLSLNSEDTNAFQRIAPKVKCYLTKQEIQAAKHFNDILENNDIAKYKKREIQMVQSHLKTIAKLRPVEAIRYIETELHYLDFLSTIGESNVRNRLDAYQAIATPCKTHYDFIRRIDELSHVTSDPNASITLSTIHRAKGLEYDQVIMLDIDPQVFPSPKNNIEEERRLFYVGMTRARKKLIINHTQFINGGYNEHSLFLKEILQTPLQSSLHHVINNGGWKTSCR